MEQELERNGAAIQTQLHQQTATAMVRFQASADMQPALTALKQSMLELSKKVDAGFDKMAIASKDIKTISTRVEGKLDALCAHSFNTAARKQNRACGKESHRNLPLQWLQASNCAIPNLAPMSVIELLAADASVIRVLLDFYLQPAGGVHSQTAQLLLHLGVDDCLPTAP